LKIAVIGSKGLPPRQGGIEHHCAEVYARMVAQGHEVDVYGRSSYTQQPWGTLQVYKGIKTISLPCLNLRGADAVLSSAIAAVQASRRPYDIIHFHALGPSLFTPVPKLLSTAKVISTCHGLDWQRVKWGAVSSQMIKWGERAAVRYADALTVVSEALQAYFSQTYGCLPIYVGNAPVPLVASDPTFAYVRSLGLQPHRYLIFVGRLVPEKCPDLLMQAFQQLKRSDWQLVIVGGKSDTQTYTETLLAQAAGCSNIVFTGELGGAKLAEIVRGAGLFVLPSKVEGLPLALLEAMQEGIPVLISDIPVHRQIVGADRGLLFAAGDLAALIQQLQWALQRPQQLAAAAQRASTYITQHYSWDAVTEGYLALYQQLLITENVHFVEASLPEQAIAK
jgi:glycosyltransferase involved in cell wall biosynthesis